MGQQRNILRPGRCAVVQPVFRVVPRKGLSHRVSHPAHTVVLHTDGSKRGILQRMGNNTQRVERLLSEDHRRARHRHHRADNIFFPAAINLRKGKGHNTKKACFQIRASLFSSIHAYHNNILETPCCSHGIQNPRYFTVSGTFILLKIVSNNDYNM